MLPWICSYICEEMQGKKWAQQEVAATKGRPVCPQGWAITYVAGSCGLDPKHWWCTAGQAGGEEQLSGSPNPLLPSWSQYMNGTVWGRELSGWYPSLLHRQPETWRESPSPALLPAGGAEHKETQTPAPRSGPMASHCHGPTEQRPCPRSSRKARGWLTAGPSGKSSSTGIWSKGLLLEGDNTRREKGIFGNLASLPVQGRLSCAARARALCRSRP